MGWGSLWLEGRSMAACYKLSTMIARAGYYLEGTLCDPGLEEGLKIRGASCNLVGIISIPWLSSEILPEIIE